MKKSRSTDWILTWKDSREMKRKLDSYLSSKGAGDSGLFKTTRGCIKKRS